MLVISMSNDRCAQATKERDLVDQRREESYFIDERREERAFSCLVGVYHIGCGYVATLIVLIRNTGSIADNPQV
jgi:hypothetical protein